MKITHNFLIVVFALSSLTVAASARADENDDLVQEVSRLASQNTDPSTAAQIHKTVDENHALIKAIFESCRASLGQTEQSQEAVHENTEPNVNPTDNSQSVAPATTTPQNTTTTNKSALLQSTALQTSHVQPSNAVQASSMPEGAHLASYPALPDVPPTSSIVHPTAAQLDQGEEFDRLLLKQKRFYMAHPNTDRYDQ